MAKAQSLIEQGDYQMAIRQYERAAYYAPDDTSILLKMIEALEEKPAETA